MPKLKINNKFGITPNMLLNDPKISWKAKGLYGYLQSKPDDWDFAVHRIARDAKDGKDGTSSGIKELETAGYLQRNKYKNDKGQWDIEYILFDHPVFIDETEEMEPETSTENPTWTDETMTENPSTENPDTENPETNKKRNTKKEKIKKIVYIEDPFINGKILEFIENRKQLKKPMTDLAIKKVVNKCLEFQKKYTSEKIGSFFDRAIESGWSGIWEIKENNGQNFQKKQQSHAYQEEGARENFAF